MFRLKMTLLLILKNRLFILKHYQEDAVEHYWKNMLLILKHTLTH